MKTVEINASRKYNVTIGSGLIDRAGDLTAKVISPCSVLIVTDDIVAPLYLERLTRSLEISGYRTSSLTLPHGESSKTAESYIKILNTAAHMLLSRSDCMIALGGGVIGDLTGFAAATYMRGIQYIQVPTTLLAMVDSSVGGKTAIDLDGGKNLVGAFYQPSAVICDTDALNTLPSDIFKSGCAEVIKYGIINDRPLFEKLHDPILPQIEDVIECCVKNKRDIVESDEYDRGKRQLLNLGHTTGHAIEKCSGFTVSHGEAVAAGTAVISRAAVALGYCTADDCARIEQLISSYGLPVGCDFSPRELTDVAANDKKRQGNSISLVFPFGIGDCRLISVKTDRLESIFELGMCRANGEA